MHYLENQKHVRNRQNQLWLIQVLNKRKKEKRKRKCWWKKVHLMTVICSRRKIRPLFSCRKKQRLRKIICFKRNQMKSRKLHLLNLKSKKVNLLQKNNKKQKSRKQSKLKRLRLKLKKNQQLKQILFLLLLQRLRHKQKRIFLMMKMKMMIFSSRRKNSKNQKKFQKNQFKKRRICYWKKMIPMKTFSKNHCQKFQYKKKKNQ